MFVCVRTSILPKYFLAEFILYRHVLLYIISLCNDLHECAYMHECMLEGPINRIVAAQYNAYRNTQSVSPTFVSYYAHYCYDLHLIYTLTLL